MTTALAAPSFADDTTTNTTLTMDAAYEAVTIAVTVPKTGAAVINPYGLPISFTLSDSSTQKITGQQITTTPVSIKNDGDVSLDVGATVTTALTEKSGMTLISTAPVTTGKNASTGKDAYVYLQLATVDDAKGDATSKANDISDAVIKASVADSTWADATKLVLSTDDAVTSSKLVTLVAATVTGTGSSQTVTYNKGSVAAVRLAGNVVTAPEDDAWATTDGFTATIAFTFTPNTSVVPEEDTSDASEEQGTNNEEQGTNNEEQGTNNEEQGTNG
jgi:hypothetical protein